MPSAKGRRGGRKAAKKSSKASSSASRAPAEAQQNDANVSQTSAIAVKKEPAMKAKRSRKTRVKHAPRPDNIFPVEVWSMILKYLLGIEGEREIARIAYLSSGIRYEAESILYHSPKLIQEHQMTQFSETIISCSRRALSVRTLMFKPLYDSDSAEISEALMSALPTMQKLTRLQLLCRAPTPYYGNQVIGALHGSRPPLKYIRGLLVLLNELNIEVLRGLSDLEEARFVSSEEQGDLQKISQLHLPKLRTLESDIMSFGGLRASLGSVTHLSITSPLDHATLDDVLQLLGKQLISLYVRRELGDYDGRMYPKLPWAKLKKLKYLRIDDRGRQVRCIPGEHEGLHTRQVPPALHTLVWLPTWTHGSMRAASTFAPGDTTENREEDIYDFAWHCLTDWPTMWRVLYGYGRRIDNLIQCTMDSHGVLHEKQASMRQRGPNGWLGVV
ncbi:hypothetical protein FKP32DRAFT_1599727 [Trametes sanguinea]|nr:hypothetical protein FKP32DRAFT_1599727 [Trametes sanguinea]